MAILAVLAQANLSQGSFKLKFVFEFVRSFLVFLVRFVLGPEERSDERSVEEEKGKQSEVEVGLWTKIEETQEKLSHRVTSRTLREGEEGGARGRHS